MQPQTKLMVINFIYKSIQWNLIFLLGTLLVTLLTVKGVKSTCKHLTIIKKNNQKTFCVNFHLCPWHTQPVFLRRCFQKSWEDLSPRDAEIIIYIHFHLHSQPDVSWNQGQALIKAGRFSAASQNKRHHDSVSAGVTGKSLQAAFTSTNREQKSTKVKIAVLNTGLTIFDLQSLPTRTTKKPIKKKGVGRLTPVDKLRNSSDPGLTFSKNALCEIISYYILLSHCTLYLYIVLTAHSQTQYSVKL